MYVIRPCGSTAPRLLVTELSTRLQWVCEIAGLRGQGLALTQRPDGYMVAVDDDGVTRVCVACSVHSGAVTSYHFFSEVLVILANDCMLE